MATEYDTRTARTPTEASERVSAHYHAQRHPLCVKERKEQKVDRQVPIATERLAEFCRRHRIHRLALFGSTAKGIDRPESDVDLLVEFEPGETPGLFALAGMELELSEMLGGRKVDLRTPRDLSRHFRDEVMLSAVVQYAA